MRWTLIVVLAFASVAAAQEPPSRTPPPPGVDISARDGDRILVDDDARIQIVRRRQATLRTIYSEKEQLLIVLVDDSKAGEFPDGQVDWAFNFYDVEGAWPLGQRWESLTLMFQYQGDSTNRTGFAFETPQGLVQLVPRGQSATPDPRAGAVLVHGGSSGSPRRGLSFAEAETVQLQDFSRSKASGATVSTLTGPAGVTGTAVLTGEIRRPNSPPPSNLPNRAPPTIRRVPSNPPVVPRPANDRKPPPVGQDISANDGDRVIVEDDARIEIVRRRQATVRTIFNEERRMLIVLADYAKPGEFPEGTVDMTFNFYELEGDWPLAPRWEALTTIFQYEGNQTHPTGYGLTTPQGLVHLSPGHPGVRNAAPTANAVLWFRGLSTSQRRGWSFEQAEKNQLAEAVKREQQR
jgi:hypothetical protein